MREYKAGTTENFSPPNLLSPERETFLRSHITECEVPFLTCDLCYELYSNIGYQAYYKLLEEVRSTYGPTTSEQQILMEK